MIITSYKNITSHGDVSHSLEGTYVLNLLIQRYVRIQNYTKIIVSSILDVVGTWSLVAAPTNLFF